MVFSRPEHRSGQPFPSPGDLSNPGIEPRSPALQADTSPVEPQGKPDTNELIYKTETDSQTENQLTVTKGLRGWGKIN